MKRVRPGAWGKQPSAQVGLGRREAEFAAGGGVRGVGRGPEKFGGELDRLPALLDGVDQRLALHAVLLRSGGFALGQTGTLWPDLQTSGVRIGFEGDHPSGVGAQQLFHAGDGGVAAAQPDDFRRVPAQNAQVGEIGVEGDDDQTVGFGVVPDDRVIRSFQTQQARMG